MGMRSSLFIANVNGAQGLYTCKATNDYGSEMSSPGELKIKGKLIAEILEDKHGVSMECHELLQFSVAFCLTIHIESR